jgi:hypothetical protein
MRQLAPRSERVPVRRRGRDGIPLHSWPVRGVANLQVFASHDQEPHAVLDIMLRHIGNYNLRTHRSMRWGAARRSAKPFHGYQDPVRDLFPSQVQKRVDPAGLHLVASPHRNPTFGQLVGTCSTQAMDSPRRTMRRCTHSTWCISIVRAPALEREGLHRHEHVRRMRCRSNPRMPSCIRNPEGMASGSRQHSDVECFNQSSELFACKRSPSDTSSRACLSHCGAFLGRGRLGGGLGDGADDTSTGPRDGVRGHGRVSDS